ncbi:hypothetical protein [Kerstersia similis]|uniref:hypothetical protein n=1 Tax=Kerstersia similis TaxID=206505 RepID=UPI0039EFD1EB
MPADNNAPEFFVVGAQEIESQQRGDFTVRYAADDWQCVHWLGLMPAHAQALRYLSRVAYADTSIPDNDRSLLVVWIGIDTRHGHTEYIPGVLQMSFPEDGSLPPAFLAQLQQWNDDRIEQVIAEYVGLAHDTTAPGTPAFPTHGGQAASDTAKP